MSKPTLDAFGTQQVLTTLYQLPEPALQDECTAIEADFGAWLATHFELTAQQTAYLGGMDEGYTDVLSAKIAYFVSGRLPIQLVAPLSDGEDDNEGDDNELPPIDHPGKLLITSELNSTTYVPGFGYNETESLLITFAPLPPPAAS